MKGDFSRQTFDATKHYRSVLMQQGRVQVDADWNEQQAIAQHHLETVTQDIIGKCGAPKHNRGFKITVENNTLKISQGRYYVDGILCENELDIDYDHQPDLPNPDEILKLLGNATFGLVYLDVWQRHITVLDDLQIREVALGGPDTATRLKTVWQVKILPLNTELTPTCASKLEQWQQLTAAKTGKLNAQTQPIKDPQNPCLVPPTAGYQRLENQLYRVEIHHGSDHPQGPTFKWSRENGSVVTTIQQINSQQITVSDLGRDEVLGFRSGQWLEIINDELELKGKTGELQLAAIDRTKSAINWGTTPAIADSSFAEGVDLNLHPQVRRWDQTSQPGVTENGTSITFDWQPLEGGIEVQFLSGKTYETGDYWLIPARTATGQIEWPGNPQLPLGIDHHYCRLTLIQVNDGILEVLEDCRSIFPPLTELPTGKGGCCTLTVGKEGDFSDFQSAIEAIETLSAQEGEWIRLCILPGIYRLESPIIITEKRRLMISGCDRQAHLLAQGDQPVFIVQNCSEITLESLWLEAESSQGTIEVKNAENITISNCQVQNYAAISSLLIQSQTAKITDNYLTGLWVQEGSTNILIQNNKIAEGWGAGIILGGLSNHGQLLSFTAGISQVEIRENDIHQMVNSGISTVTQELKQGGGDIEDLAILGNRIVQCVKEEPNAFFNPLAIGGIILQGISLVRIKDNFIADNGVAKALPACGIFIYDCQGLEIENNTVINNGKIQPQRTCINFSKMSEGQRPNPLIEQGVSFLGRDFQQAPVSQNRIDRGLDCHYSTEIQLPSPVNSISFTCLRFNDAPAQATAYNSSGEIVGQAAIISGTSISMTGTDIVRVILNTPQNETFLLEFCFSSNLQSLNAIQAGIFVFGSIAPLNILASFPKTNAIFAAKIHQNTVISPQGQALILMGLGAMSVLGNTLTSLGVGKQPEQIEQYTQLGKCVFILNLGRDTLLSQVNNNFLTNPAAVNFNRSFTTVIQRSFPDGRVLFQSNQVTLEQLEPVSQIIFGSVAIFSADDVSLQDNQILSEIEGGIPINDNFSSVALLTNVLAVSSSLRSCGNRFNELPKRVLLSYLSFGFFNITTNNQATHCIIANGNVNLKDPNQEIIEVLSPGYCPSVIRLFATGGINQ